MRHHETFTEHDVLDDGLTGALLNVLDRPDLRVVARNIAPSLDASLDQPFRLATSRTAVIPKSCTMSLVLGRVCLEQPALAPTTLRHAIELAALLESGVDPLIASVAAARVATLFHRLDTANVPPLPFWLTPFTSETSPQPEILRAAWPALNTLLPVRISVTDLDIARLADQLARLWPLLAPAETLMSSGGDSRLAVDPETGLNRYACSHRPRPWAITFGSSTASSLSERGFGGAEAARRTLISGLLSSEDVTQPQNRIVQTARHAIGRHFGVAGDAVLLSASGTDCELAVLAITAGQSRKPVTNILIAPDETGSGVPLAASGRNFATDSACAVLVGKGDLIEGFDPDIRILGVAIRNPDGSARPAADIDAECEALALQEAEQGRHVLLHRLDQSKTGIAAPSMPLVQALRNRLGDSLDIVVDACQTRLHPDRIARWVKDGIMVMVTGSKFFTGPPFCGALLLPEHLREGLAHYSLPQGLRNYSNRSEWPETADQSALNIGYNIGLALRWHAAIAEMDALFALPDATIRQRLEHFMQAAREMLARTPSVIPLPVFCPDDTGLWDCVPTILPFLVEDPRHPGHPLALDDARRLHRWLNADLSPWVRERDASLMCVLGQPVPVSHEALEEQAGALRLCAGARLVSGEPSHAGLDEQQRLARECQDAGRVLGKLGLILRHWETLLAVDPVPHYAPFA